MTGCRLEDRGCNWVGGGGVGTPDMAKSVGPGPPVQCTYIYKKKTMLYSMLIIFTYFGHFILRVRAERHGVACSDPM